MLLYISAKYVIDSHGFWVCLHYDIDLAVGDMILSEGHATSLGHGQQLWIILCRSSLAVRSLYCQGTDFWYLCTLSLTLEIWHWTKVMKHPWNMDKNCVKYYLDPTKQWGVIAHHLCKILYRSDKRVGSLAVMARTKVTRYDPLLRSWHILGHGY